MNYYKKIKGEKIYLSPINLEDIKKYTNWINDLQISTYLMGTSKVISEAKEEELLKELTKSDNNAVFAILTNNDQLIGNCGLHMIDHKNQKGTLGIFIGDKDYWDHGYGTEAIKLVLSYGFYFLNLYNINLEVYSFNERAISCYKKIGFKEIGRRRKSIILGGKYYDEVYMDVLRDEFDNEFKDLVEELAIKI